MSTTDARERKKRRLAVALAGLLSGIASAAILADMLRAPIA